MAGFTNIGGFVLAEADGVRSYSHWGYGRGHVPNVLGAFSGPACRHQNEGDPEYTGECLHCEDGADLRVDTYNIDCVDCMNVRLETADGTSVDIPVAANWGFPVAVVFYEAETSRIHHIYLAAE